jgi:hypothetical protein
LTPERASIIVSASVGSECGDREPQAAGTRWSMVAVHKALADAHTQIAGILKSGG